MEEKNLTELEFMLLSALVTMGPTHPYRLGREVEERAGKGIVSLGALYKALHRLEQQGYLESEWEDVDPSEVKRPRRRIYEVIGVGERALERARKTRVALYGEAAGGLAWQP